MGVPMKTKQANKPWLINCLPAASRNHMSILTLIPSSERVVGRQ